jgi:hypothetical protein
MSDQLARQQERLAFLKKNRPNDPEIKQLQKKIGATPGAPAAPPPPLQESATNYAADIAAQSGVNQAFTPTLTERPLQADLNQARLGQQQELEDYLGRDIDAAYEQARKQEEQRLFNKGVPMGSEQYKDGMKMLDDNFARQRGDIRAQALQFGGQEMDRTFGMGEARRAGELSEQTGINQTNLGNMGVMTDIDLAYKQLAEQRRQANQGNKIQQGQLGIQRQQLARQGRGGGGSAIAQSPFVG